jgi:hypothetical protein
MSMFHQSKRMYSYLLLEIFWYIQDDLESTQTSPHSPFHLGFKSEVRCEDYSFLLNIRL